MKFIWGENGSQDETNLLCKILFDEQKQPIRATRFFYDEFGNVTEEKFYGNLTGEGEALLLNSDGFPEDTTLEVYAKRSQYSRDGKHLLYVKEEDNGLKVKYSYLGNTPLPEIEEYYDHDTPCKRTVYTYDRQKNLIQETLEDLRGTTKLITRYTLKNAKETYACMPETIEELAGDDLVRKTFLHYGAGAKISRKDIFDDKWGREIFSR
ncbi:MAG: hypothetical protein V4489_00055 [Chlamydiota bacterium]